MKNIVIFLFLLFTQKVFSTETNIESIMYKDLLINQVNFSESDFQKTISNNYKKFFNKFVIDKELKEKLIEKNSLSDVLNVCYNVSQSLYTDFFKGEEIEGDYCLKSYVYSGSKEALYYLSTLNFNRYKVELLLNKRNDLTFLYKSVFYSGMAENGFYFEENGLLKS